MFINELLNQAGKRLTTIGTETLLVDAARALSGFQSELIVVCDPDGKAVEVITKADVVPDNPLRGSSMSDHRGSRYDAKRDFLPS